ncbi:EAL domain-containing protein [Noviherbaspirillum sp. 17J57-3]|uniref:EAL domain-containing protein n=2 Tax=Noviherbaspirillum galbum TaxID=2709383 RepID=A0A6B3SSW7_9BURK|nr:EAL domain-containing protein [Noviherbaspirillum galbum]
MKADEPISFSSSVGSDELFQRLFRRHGSIMLLIDPASERIIDANRAAAAFYGYREDELRNMPITRINTHSPEEIRSEMQQAVEEKRNYFFFHHRLADGQVRNVEVHSSTIESRMGTLLFSIVFDVTKRRQAEEAQRMASLVYQNSHEAMSVVDKRGLVVTVNPAFSEITGYAPQDIIGRDIAILGSDREDPQTFNDMMASVLATGKWQGELWTRRRDGEKFLRSLSINTVHGDDGGIVCRVSQFSDITRRKESDALIWRQANFDALTGLPNRSMFHDRLEQALKKAQRNDAGVALLFLDLDGFKEVNDTLGHGMGDRVLQAAARRLQQCVRETDTVARLGGDEFSVIIGDVANVHDVERAVHAILHIMCQPFDIGAEPIYLSASVGITFYPDDGEEGATLLKNADQAMYAAKEQGRNRFSFFMSSMQDAAQARKRLVNDLRVALAENQFCLHYQPIVELRTGAIHKAEALVRWQHPRHGLVSPAAFIPIAEQTGLIAELGDWVFRQAARDAARWYRAGKRDFQVSVNVSPLQFQSGGIDHHAWLRHLQGLGIAGQNIVVEITESILMDKGAEVTESLLRFRDAGMQVALDDFGTGYSSLAYLKKFDIDYIKIDRAFVQNLAPGSDDLALCEAIIVMTHKLGMKVIAEGVETEMQRDLLAASGCDYAQGYLFSRPVCAEDFDKLL